MASVAKGGCSGGWDMNGGGLGGKVDPRILLYLWKLRIHCFSPLLSLTSKLAGKLDSKWSIFVLKDFGSTTWLQWRSYLSLAKLLQNLYWYLAFILKMLAIA